MLEVFFRAVEDLDQRRHRPLQPRNARALELHLRHLLTTDPRTCIVAEDGGRVTAFGVLMVREGHAFLSFLFVLPAWQARGIGRAVLGACLATAGPMRCRSTCAEADQLVSTGLYASLGLAPREPVYLLRGELHSSVLPELPPGLRAGPIDPAAPGLLELLGSLDLAVMGYRRPVDHAFWTAGGRLGWWFEAEGQLLGYGYAHPGGRLGPLLATELGYLPAMLGHLVRHVAVLEGHQAIVPGSATTALDALLAAGLRLDGTPAVYCTDRPVPRFDRYLPMSFALL